MSKQPTVRLNKGLVVVVILAVITLAAGIASVVLLSHNTSIAQLFGGIDNVYESARLEKLTINGYMLGDKMSEEALEYHALDADFDYYYDGVAFWSKNKKIVGLGFYTTTTGTGDDKKTIIDINTVDIRYEGRRLVTIDDFEESFGIGAEKADEDGKTIPYRQGGYELSIRTRGDIVYNVILKQNQ
jgi:hypothetical protein